MLEYDVAVAKTLEDDAVAVVVQDICGKEGLVLQMKTSLKKYPGCTHWHFKRPTEQGVLEVTWWPGNSEKRPPRLWLSVHGNREAAWISERMPRLGALIEKQLNASP